MVKRKRKFTEVREKKNKKFKKVSAKEAPETPLGTEEACPKGEATFETLQESDPELSPEERRIQERKLKKERKKEERKRLREAGIKAQTPPAQRSGAELALDYLCSWAQKCKNWKFQKTRQTWLLLNMYDSDKVPSEHFSTLLAYLEGLKGQARELTVQKAEAMMQELDKEGAGDPEPLLLEKMQRIRQVLQLLS
ncbi:uncharacterized protein C7orf50 homolog [Talpa occidentalis]|uniref:uncharacterized protein C7orf50 homolog n=1 Tax=Talpa occidentalis TaxID=50954 RepID=UPI0023F6A086|nr:uncharacterized protein C7orf50 homolog [Talpa occidentalis]